MRSYLANFANHRFVRTYLYVYNGQNKKNNKGRLNIRFTTMGGLEIIGRMRTPVGEAFSYGMRHVFIVIH